MNFRQLSMGGLLALLLLGDVQAQGLRDAIVIDAVLKVPRSWVLNCWQICPTVSMSASAWTFIVHSMRARRPYC